MLITPHDTENNVYIIRFAGTFWALCGPRENLVEYPKGWQIMAHAPGQEPGAWPVTRRYDRKWDAIAALARLIDKPWSY